MNIDINSEENVKETLRRVDVFEKYVQLMVALGIIEKTAKNLLISFYDEFKIR